MADGSALGIRQCEILNRTIHALSVSRLRLAELKDWEEAKRAGVYFLFGKSEDGSLKAYVGEAQRVIDRISTHLREKDFWNEVVIFVNKDENMHPKYLEARLIDVADRAGRYVLENGKGQEVPVLSRADKAAMEEIIPDIRLILGVLGHLILEPIDVLPVASPNATKSTAEPILAGREFRFTGPAFDAKGRITDEGFLVMAGSTAAREFKAGNAGYERLREKLIQNGTLKVEADRLVFARDFPADSSSQAASVVAGGNRSGPGSWKNEGRTLGDLEAASVAISNDSVS